MAVRGGGVLRESFLELYTDIHGQDHKFVVGEGWWVEITGIAEGRREWWAWAKLVKTFKFYYNWQVHIQMPDAPSDHLPPCNHPDFLLFSSPLLWASVRGGK